MLKNKMNCSAREKLQQNVFGVPIFIELPVTDYDNALVQMAKVDAKLTLRRNFPLQSNPSLSESEKEREGEHTETDKEKSMKQA